MQRLVLHLAKDRVHHDEQPNGWRNTTIVSVSSIICIACGLCHIPIGIETPTNLPFFNDGPVLGTKFPSRMPTIIASKIQRARKRSSNPRLLKAETFSARGGRLSSWFSASLVPGNDPESLGYAVEATRSSLGFIVSSVAICAAVSQFCEDLSSRWDERWQKRQSEHFESAAYACFRRMPIFCESSSVGTSPGKRTCIGPLRICHSLLIRKSRT